jgi:thioesterase domain-containing protein/acyl carrier protein
MIEHSGVCNMITDIKSRYQLCAKDRMLQFAALAFDVSVQEIFITLTAGAALVLRNDEWLVGASNFWALCIKNGVTIVKLPTAFWQHLIQEEQIAIPSTIRQMVIGGEAISSTVLAAWFARKSYCPTLFNAYGPTETTVNSTIHALSADSLSWQSIGRPIANTYIYILDANKQPTPIGLAGELYIGGAGIARGYLKQADMTAERFLPDPFAKDADARLYKTGDLVRWLADGTIEFLGRNDFQVKIRGFRVELGYIETKLAEHPSIREVAVLASEDYDGFKRLLAYVVLKESFIPNVSELREFLKALLPEFMIPSAFVFLDTLPLTANGKLDRKALPQPDQSQYELEGNFVAPRNSVEAQLAEIWCNILKMDRVSVHDNFFHLGGHSLLTVKMIVEVNALFNINLPLGAIYQFPTIEGLATCLSSEQQQASYYSLVPIHTQGSRPPLFAIHTITLEDLPRHLGKEQPLYFLRYGMAAAISESPTAVRLPSLEELASHYIKEMQQAQPQGPYYIVGFSFGGVIAYEMAGQLLAKGQQVNLVGLLDTALTTEKQLRPLKQMIYRFPRRVLALIKRKIAALLTPQKASIDFWPHFYTPEPDQACRSAYQPKLYNAQVTLFQGWEEEDRFFIYAPPEHAWKQLLGDKVDVQQIHGSHYEIFDEPHVKILAAKIIACMDKAIAGKDTR